MVNIRKNKILTACIVVLTVLAVLGGAFGIILLAYPNNQVSNMGLYFSIKCAQFSLRRPITPKGEVVFFGDSITDNCWLSNYYDFKTVNLGISGDTSAGLLKRMQFVYAAKPKIVVLLIGVNDITRGYTDDEIVGNIASIVGGIQQRLTDTSIIMQTIYPVNLTGIFADSLVNHKPRIAAINARLKPLALALGCSFLDIYSVLADENGDLRTDYSDDGLHPNDAGYKALSPIISAEVERLKND